MRSPVSFFAFGTPKGQPRVRATIRGRHAGVYDPGTADEWKKGVRSAWAVTHTDRFDTAVSVSLMFYLPRPKSHLRKTGILRPSAPKHHTQKPDCDNLAKAVLDALTNSGAWSDDDQVVRLNIQKHWAIGSAGCQISIREAE